MAKKNSVISDDLVLTGILQTAASDVAIINNFARSIRPPDLATGQDMGEDSGWTYAQKALVALTSKRDLVMQDLVNFDDFTLLVESAEKLMAIKKAYGNWVGETKETFLLIGKHLMAYANYVRSSLQTLSAKVSSYKKDYDDINFLYDNRAKKAAATVETKKRIAELTKQVEDLRQQVENPPVKQQ
jgi:hypothetical protein